MICIMTAGDVVDSEYYEISKRGQTQLDHEEEITLTRDVLQRGQLIDSERFRQEISLRQGLRV